MGKPLMLQPEDDERIESLKERLGTRTKVDVVRAGLRLLELEAERTERAEQWKRAAKAASRESAHVNAEFQKNSRLKRT